MCINKSRSEVLTLELESIGFSSTGNDEKIESSFTDKSPIILDACGCHGYDLYDRCFDLAVTFDIIWGYMTYDSFLVASISKHSSNIRSQEPPIILIISQDGRRLFSPVKC